jgi:hypothetical protein
MFSNEKKLKKTKGTTKKKKETGEKPTLYLRKACYGSAV